MKNNPIELTIKVEERESEDSNLIAMLPDKMLETWAVWAAGWASDFNLRPEVHEQHADYAMEDANYKPYIAYTDAYAQISHHYMKQRRYQFSTTILRFERFSQAESSDKLNFIKWANSSILHIIEQKHFCPWLSVLAFIPWGQKILRFLL